MNVIERRIQDDARTGALAPDTSGWNFFTADRGLADLMTLYLPEDLRSHLTPYLERLGALAAGRLDRAAH
ncbi:MAG: hypothetical protein ACR2PA_02495, partial [Hyphomicrobiaceae bacterium]